MQNTKVLIKKYLVVFIGQVIIGTGCAFLVSAGMGNDPMGVMVSGISKHIGLSFGTVTNLANFVMFVGLLLFYRKRMSLTTLITVVVVGWTIDPVAAFLGGMHSPEIVVKGLYPIIGCVVISLGVAFYLCIDFGASITDNVILMIGDLAHKSYAFGCYTLYIIYFSLGLLFGGVWGYATLMTLLLNGKMIDKLTPVFRKTVGAWANRG